MLKLIDASFEITQAYDDGHFSLNKWEEYIDKMIPSIKEKCLEDMKDSVSEEHSWSECFLPVLNNVFLNKERVKLVSSNFHRITDTLEKRVVEKFGRLGDVTIALYLGLCNGAGWVTEINGKTYILLGVEKIIELNWDSINDMNGLILHELGHVYQNHFGVLERNFTSSEDCFLWQLFTEGIAMVFEQEIIDDDTYFHQDENGWKDWCERNCGKIANDFKADLTNMNRSNQRYFGDWVSYNNHSDVGYYLGACFVRYILKNALFDEIINYGIDEVERYFNDFVKLQTQ